MRYSVLMVLSFICHVALGQVSNPEFTAIESKFAKGSFVSALESAEALIDNDKHKKKPEPYLWAAMCFYELYLSEDPKIIESYKNALRDALKHAGKAVSKDKNGNVVSSNAEFFNTLKKAAIAYAQECEAASDFRKASYTYKQILDFAADDAYVRFAKGVTDIRLSSMFEAEKEIKVAFPVLEANYRNLDYKPDPISAPLLKGAVVYYIDHLTGSNYVDSARTVLLTARVFFPLDEQIKQKLEDLK